MRKGMYLHTFLYGLNGIDNNWETFGLVPAGFLKEQRFLLRKNRGVPLIRF